MYLSGNSSLFKELITALIPDLVLLDPYVKGQERWDLLEGIKKQDPNLPVLILTPYADAKNSPCQPSADGYVVKSSCLGELKKKLSEMLRPRLGHQPVLGEDDQGMGFKRPARDS